MAKVHVPGRLFGAGERRDRLNQLEEGYIFRVSRGVPLGLSALATAGLVGALLLVFFTLIPARAPRDPAPVSTPPEVAISVAEVKSALQPVAVAAPDTITTAAADAAAATSPPANLQALELARRVHAVRQRFPGSRYPWDDVYQTYCVSSYFDTCFRTQTVKTAEGIGGTLMQVISRYDQSGGTEWVQIPKGPGYSLNTSNIPVKLRILDELNTVLAGVGVASRREALAAWAGMRAQQEEARQAAIQAEQERFARERAAEEARHAADVAKKQALRATAISVVGIAVTALWIIGLTLALLAIERNTRALREVSRRQEATGAALPTTQAAVPETVS